MIDKAALRKTMREKRRVLNAGDAPVQATATEEGLTWP